MERLELSGVPLRELYPKGRNWTNENSAAGLIVVEDGLVEQFVLANTQKQVIALHYPGEPPALWIPRAHLHALTASRARLLTSKDVADLIESEETICRPLRRATEWQVDVASSWLENIARKEANGRLAHFLCEHAYRSGTSGFNEPVVQRLTQQAIASIVRLTPVQVNRTFAKLLKEKLIEREPGTLKLKNYAELARLGSFRAESFAPL